MQTLYLLFFIDLGTRRVHIAGVTTHPDHQWVTQRARQLVWKLKEEALPILYLIHDRDSKFTASFDNLFITEGIDILETPVRAPNANAYAELGTLYSRGMPGSHPDRSCTKSICVLC